MIDRLKLLWKSLTGEINTLKAICKLICTAIGYISSFFSLAVLLKDLAAWDKLEVWMKGHWQIIMIAGLLISCVHNRKKINYKKMVTIFYKGIMPSEKILDLPVDCNTLTGSVNL